MDSPLRSTATNSSELSTLLQNNSHDHERLGQILLKQKLIDVETLRQALKLQDTSHKKKLGEILIDIGATTHTTIQCALMESAHFPHVELDEFDIDVQALALISANLAKDMHIIPLMFHDKSVVFASDTLPDEQNHAMLRFIVDRPVTFAIAKHEEIEQAIRRWYQDFTTDQELENFEQANTELTDEQRIWNYADQLAKKAPLVRLVDSIIHDAVSQHASDIHFRPSEKSFELLFRIDGTLIQIRQFKSGLLPAVVSRIKIMSGLNIAEHRLPQDGRIKFKDGAQYIDLRISFIPMQYGESIVLRILNKNEGIRSIDEIGFNSADQERFHDLIKRSYGIILVTGPTGSGKSTTLYAALKEVARDNVNIITAEDPIEYELANTRQIQLIQQINFGFPQALRHILRHDPDVIMIGEMRDVETCKIAIESALTGHLVLSTLHTNDAAGALVRLMEIGIAPYMIQSAVIGIVAQRLVRCNCKECLCEEDVSALIRKNLNLTADEKFYRGAGCKHCHFTGFKGRMAIVELLVMNDELREHIHTGVSSHCSKVWDDNDACARNSGSAPETGFYRRGLSILHVRNR